MYIPVFYFFLDPASEVKHLRHTFSESNLFIRWVMEKWSYYHKQCSFLCTYFRYDDWFIDIFATASITKMNLEQLNVDFLCQYGIR